MYLYEIEETFETLLNLKYSPEKIQKELKITETEFEVYQKYVKDETRPDESKQEKLKRLRKEKMNEFLNSGKNFSNNYIIAQLGISQPTYHRYKKELKQEEYEKELQEEQSNEPSLLDDVTAPSRQKLKELLSEGYDVKELSDKYNYKETTIQSILDTYNLKVDNQPKQDRILSHYKAKEVFKNRGLRGIMNYYGMDEEQANICVKNYNLENKLKPDDSTPELGKPQEVTQDNIETPQPSVTEPQPNYTNTEATVLHAETIRSPRAYNSNNIRVLMDENGKITDVHINLQQVPIPSVYVLRFTRELKELLNNYLWKQQFSRPLVEINQFIDKDPMGQLFDLEVKHNELITETTKEYTATYLENMIRSINEHDELDILTHINQSPYITTGEENDHFTFNAAIWYEPSTAQRRIVKQGKPYIGNDPNAYMFMTIKQHFKLEDKSTVNH